MLREIILFGELILGAYLLGGLMFAIPFHWHWMRRIDPGTSQAGAGFRLLITPGVIALWPLLAVKVSRALRGGAFLGEQESPVSTRRIRTIHRRVWIMWIVLFGLLFAAFIQARRKQETRRGVTVLESIGVRIDR